MAKKPEIVQVKVRMTTDLQRKLQRAADAHGQTSNAEILARLIQSFEMGQLLANAADSIEEVRQVARGAIKGRDEALQVARSALEGRERSGELFITALSQRTGASADVIRGVIDEFEKAEDKGND